MVLYAILPPTEESKELARATALGLDGEDAKTFVRHGATFDVWKLGENGRKLVESFQSKSRVCVSKVCYERIANRVQGSGN